MNLRKDILAAGLWSAVVLISGCLSEASPSETKVQDETGALFATRDPATSSYRFEGKAVDAAWFPWSIKVNNELRGMLRSPSDVVEVKGVDPSAQILVLPRPSTFSEDTASVHDDQKVTLNSCYIGGGAGCYCAGGYEVTLIWVTCRYWCDSATGCGFRRSPP